MSTGFGLLWATNTTNQIIFDREKKKNEMKGKRGEKRREKVMVMDKIIYIQCVVSTRIKTKFSNRTFNNFKCKL